MREFKHSGVLGWLFASAIGIAGIVYLLGLTLVEAERGRLPIGQLVVLLALLPFVAWGVRCTIQTASVRLILLGDGLLERRGILMPTLRIPLSQIQHLERYVVGEEMSPVLKIRYGHRDYLEWRAEKSELAALVARIQAANPHVTVDGEWL